MHADSLDLQGTGIVSIPNQADIDDLGRLFDGLGAKLLDEDGIDFIVRQHNYNL